jgi:hypothetical protein
LEFEREFVRAGGLLLNGLDPERLIQSMQGLVGIR